MRDHAGDSHLLARKMTGDLRVRVTVDEKLWTPAPLAALAVPCLGVVRKWPAAHEVGLGKVVI